MKKLGVRLFKILLVMIMLLTDLLVGNLGVISAESVSSGPYYFDNPPSVSSYTLPGEITLGWVNSDKVVKDATSLYVPRLPFVDEGYGAIETNIEVTRLDENGNPYETITGRALALSNLSREADAGYVFVHPNEATNWIKVLNGNPNHVLSQITTYEIYKNEDRSRLVYRAYNLAEIAYHSGGRGNPQGDGLKRSGSRYIKYDYFEATPRPSQQKIVASASPGGTPKTTFKANETIYLQGTAKDYSIYDKGITPVNIAIINTKTNGEYQSAAGGASLSKCPPLSTGIDIYKGTFVATDRHGRSVQGSTDYSASKPAEVLISVEAGVCTPVTATLTVSGEMDKTLASGSEEPLPKGKNTITLKFPQTGSLIVNGSNQGSGTTFANIYISNKTNIEFKPSNATYCSWTKTFTSDGGGNGGDDPGDNECDYIINVQTLTGSGKQEINTDLPSDTENAMDLAYDTDTIMLKSDIEGKFYIDNQELESSSGTAALVPNFPKGETIFTLRFVSEDGKECWTKKFFVLPRTGEGYSCPTFKTESGKTLSNGSRHNAPLYGELEIRAWFKSPSGGEDHVPVFWKLTKPDGSVELYGRGVNDDGDNVIIKTDHLQIPDPDLIDETSEGFNQVGTYTLEYYYSDSDARYDPYKTWKEQGCEWKIFIDVSACNNIHLNIRDKAGHEIVNGSDGTYNYQLELSKNLPSHPIEVKSGRVANWVLKSVNDAVPLHTATNTDTFEYTIDQFGEYILTATFKVGDETCVKTVHITFGANCDDLKIIAMADGEKVEPTSGSGTKADPYVIPLTPGQDNRFSMFVELDGEIMNSDHEWSLYRNGVLQYRDDESSFLVIIHNGSAEYSVRVDEYMDGIMCERWAVFRIVDPDDPPPVDPELRCQDVYMHLYTEEKNYLDVAPAPEHTGSVSLSTADKLDRFAISMVDSPTTSGTAIHVKWESPLTNMAPSEFAHSLFIGEDVPAGTYTIKATVDEPGNPNINGCVFVLTVTITKNGTTPPDGGGGGPGGPIDGGKMSIRIYDSTNRLLTSTADGVWEKEPARIEVTIDQSRIDNAFSTINAEIQRAIDAKKADYLSKYSGEEYEDVQVQNTPATWNAKTNPATAWPSSFTLSVTGPGIDQSYQLQPKLQTQSKTYTGTITPTTTTWQLALHQEDYQAATEDFSITAPYQIEFQVNYSKCETKKDEDDEEGSKEQKTCTAGSESGSLSGTYTIHVQGAQAQFEVYEPNARGSLDHTAEWKEYHARDRYPGTKENDFYAGERILARVQFDSKHRHPYSNRYPSIVSATAWISETGQRSTQLQSTLALQAVSTTLWKGPSYQVAKLGTREMGVDTELMGHKQLGFQKGSSNAVYFHVQFGFGVSKGHAYPDKQSGAGHDPADYRIPFLIIANAWERQGIRNHTSH